MRSALTATHNGPWTTDKRQENSHGNACCQGNRCTRLHFDAERSHSSALLPDSPHGRPAASPRDRPCDVRRSAWNCNCHGVAHRSGGWVAGGAAGRSDGLRRGNWARFSNRPDWVSVRNEFSPPLHTSPVTLHQRLAGRKPGSHLRLRKSTKRKLLTPEEPKEMTSPSARLWLAWATCSGKPVVGESSFSPLR